MYLDDLGKKALRDTGEPEASWLWEGVLHTTHELSKR